MRLGIFAKTFPGRDPLTVMRAAGAAGYASVQYNMACSGLDPMPDVITPDQTAAIRAASLETGVTIAAVSGTYNMIHPDPAVRADGLRRLAVLIDASQAMGTGIVTVCSGTRDPHDQWRHHPGNAAPEAWADLLTEMGRACALAEAKGVRLGIEPELANVVDSAAKARMLIDALKSPAPAIILDPANLFEVADGDQRRSIISSAVDLLADRIVMAHAKDRHPDGSFATAGKGVVDFAHFLAVLKAAGFDGDLVTHGLAAGEAAAVVAFLRGAGA
jgi:sugar phosphate isomerase/epimerase